MQPTKSVLLIRDYSGMMSQVSRGLRHAGIDVTHASIADSFKGNYGCDLNLERRVIGLKLVDQYLNYIRLIFKKKSYDVIHLQTQLLGGPYSLLLIPIIFLLRLKCKKMTLSLAGDDYKYWKYGKERLNYTPQDDAVNIDMKGGAPYYRRIDIRFVCWFVEQIVDSLIPACYDYAVCHKENSKLTIHVPFLWNVDETPLRLYNCDPELPIRIFHGISRKGFKGSAKIIKALELIKKQYGEKVAISIPERIPYSEYRRSLENCDIFIDQCNSYSYGMAAVEAMAYGKVVLSGAEDVALAYMGAADCPIINVRPEVSDICEKLQKLIDDPNNLCHIGTRSRQFAERFHSSKNIIPKLYKIWFGAELNW